MAASLSGADVRDPPLPGAWLRGAAALGLVGLVEPIAAAVGRVRGGRRRPDAFYDAPAVVPARPGALLRDEPFTRAMPAGSTARRILYTTTHLDGSLAVASALVVVPNAPAAGRRPVIAWAHGTTGIARHSAPSLVDDPFDSGAMPSRDAVIARGWLIVATDYIGLGTAGPHRYLVGSEAARAVLDAVRAAPVPGAAGSGPVVVWGHSQGGGAALWAGRQAGEYAPELPLAGIAALSPASDLPALASTLGSVRGGAIFAAYAICGMCDSYPEIRFEDWVRPGCRRLVRRLAARGIAGADALVAIVGGLLAPSPIWRRDPTTGALGRRLRENVPSGRIEVPVLIGQGGADSLVKPAAQAAFAEGLQAAGTDVDYRTYEGFDHTGVVRPGSPLIDDLLAWTAERFAVG